MKKTAKTYQVLLSVIFLLLISCCFLNDFFRFYKVPEISETEKRKLALKPVFDINNLDPYPKQYQNFFNDQFPFREDFGFLNSLLCFFVFHQSPLPGEVEIGKNGWLFYDQKESVVYQGKFRISDAQVSALAAELHRRAVAYRSLGTRFYIAFPPIKPEIYPEYLPVGFRRAPNGTVTDKIVAAIKKDTLIQYIDLREALINAKPKGRLYNLNDNHWNRIGAFYGYAEIISRMREDFPGIKPITRSDFHFKPETRPGGNLALLIGLSSYLKEVEYDPILKNTRSQYLAPPHKKPDWAANIEYYELVKSTGDSTRPSMVVVRDSFTNSLMPYLDESFNTITYIFDGWKYGSNEEIIGDLKPEIVLLIIFEPHISHLIGL